MWFRLHPSVELAPGARWSIFRERHNSAVEPREPSLQTALVTGASSGIGRELAKILAGQHYNLVLVARDRARLNSLAAELESVHGVTVTSITQDLSKPDAPPRLVAEIRQRSLTIDILINNAGFATGGKFTSTDVEQTMAMLNVNVVSLAHLTRLLLPGMVSRSRGRVLNVASIAGFYPGPLTACYNASKAFVVSFSLGLCNELQGTGVTVTCLCPGPTRTCFAERAGLSDTRAFSENVMDAAAVADEGFAAMMAAKPMVVSGVRNKLRMLPIPLVPNRVLAHFSRKYHEV